MHNQQAVFGEILNKPDTIIVVMSGECRVHVYFPPLPLSQGQGWGHTPLKGYLTHLPTPELAQLYTQTTLERCLTST